MFIKFSHFATVVLGCCTFMQNCFVDGLKCQHIFHTTATLIPDGAHRSLSQDCEGVGEKCVRARVLTNSLGFFLNMTVGYCGNVTSCVNMTCKNLHSLTDQSMMEHDFRDHRFNTCKVACCTEDHCNLQTVESILGESLPEESGDGGGDSDVSGDDDGAEGGTASYHGSTMKIILLSFLWMVHLLG